MDTWVYDIAAVIKILGGEASLMQIYSALSQRRGDLPTEWRALIRGTIYHHSSDSRIYVSGNPDIFRRVGRGEWALRDPSDQTVGKKSDFLPINLPFIAVLQSMGKEELESLIRDGRIKQTLEAKAEELKRRYRMG